MVSLKLLEENWLICRRLRLILICFWLGKLLYSVSEVLNIVFQVTTKHYFKVTWTSFQLQVSLITRVFQANFVIRKRMFYLITRFRWSDNKEAKLLQVDIILSWCLTLLPVPSQSNLQVVKCRSLQVFVSTFESAIWLIRLTSHMVALPAWSTFFS